MARNVTISKILTYILSFLSIFVKIFFLISRISQISSNQFNNLPVVDFLNIFIEYFLLIPCSYKYKTLMGQKNASFRRNRNNHFSGFYSEAYIHQQCSLKQETHNNKPPKRLRDMISFLSRLLLALYWFGDIYLLTGRHLIIPNILNISIMDQIQVKLRQANKVISFSRTSQTICISNMFVKERGKYSESRRRRISEKRHENKFKGKPNRSLRSITKEGTAPVST